MAKLILGDAYMAVARLLVLFVWSITPVSWMVVMARVAYLVAATHLSSSELDLFRSHPTLGHLYPSSHPWISNSLFVYCMIEVAFSLNYAYQARKIQGPGPRPLYGKRFLRAVFSKVLESGLKGPNGVVGSASDRSTGRISERADELRHRLGIANGSVASATTQHTDEVADADDVRRLGRLRTASFVPAFVQRPFKHDDPRAIRFQEAQAKWFFGSPFDYITRRDVQQWLAWSLFATTLEEIEEEHNLVVSDGGGANGRPKVLESAVPSPLPPSVATFGGLPPSLLEEEDIKGVRAAPGEWDPTKGSRLEFLEYCRELMEARQGRPYPIRSPQWSEDHDEVTSERLRMMRLTIDPVRVSSRPLASYLVTNALSQLVILKSISGGFQRKQEGRLTYLVRTPADWDAKVSKTTPLIFLHGLGIGLAQYAALVNFFLASPDFRRRPVLILLQPNISQSPFSPAFLAPFGHHETTAAFRRIIAASGWQECGVTVLSHSYGSLVHSWLIKSLGETIRRSCFVDPVCFMLWVPYVCGNFLYKRVETPIELLMRYFVARELGTANTLCRHFDWSSCSLWPDEIPNLTDPSQTRFYLAEHDAILHAGDTRDYLHETGVPEECLYYGEGKVHGEMLMHGGDEFNAIMRWTAD